MIFASWGMLNPHRRSSPACRKLEAVFYAAGNVKAFAQQLVDHDITLVSAWAINAIPVAEMCLAQIPLSLRGYFRSVQGYRELHDPAAAKRFMRLGVANETIGLIGMGHIGTCCAGCCATTRSRSSPTIRYSRPSVPPNSTSSRSISPRSSAASRTSSQQPHSRPAFDPGTLGASLFAAMREGATFINTGRGASVVEAELIAVLQDRTGSVRPSRRHLAGTAGGRFRLWTLPNVVISPHIGGTIGNEVTWLSACAIEEFEARTPAARCATK
ncbi:MAG: NAD(P)-dependent oxidoreductase [Geminicoccaceae bacterium]